MLRKKSVNINTSAITVQPVQQIAQPGQIVSFSVIGSDTTGVTFQWMLNGNTISGATGDSLLVTVDNITTNNPNVGKYSVAVTNSAGTVMSASALLLLDSNGDGLPDQGPPGWFPPDGWEIQEFGSPLTYHPSEADSDSDGVANLDEFYEGTNPNDGTSFQPRLVAYSDAGGSVTIIPMSLIYDQGESVTVTAIPLAPNFFVGWAKESNINHNFNGENLLDDNNQPNIAQSYTFNIKQHTAIRARMLKRLPPGLVAWWRAEGNTQNIIEKGGTVDSQISYDVGKVSISPKSLSELGQAFKFSDNNEYIIISNSDQSLNVGPGSGFTLEAWIKPDDAISRYPLFEWHNPNSPNPPPWGAHLWISETHDTYGGPGSLFANIRDTSGNDHFCASPTGLIVANVWQHVALTYDQSSGVVILFLNGLQVAWKNLKLDKPKIGTPDTGHPLYLGYRPAGDPEPQNVFYSGLIDEPTIYNRALTVDEIYGIYSADFVGKDSIRPYFITSPLLNTPQNAPYKQQLAIILGTAPISYSLSTGPTWMTISPSGMVSGIPSVPGIFEFVVRATDSTGLFTEINYILTVS